MKWFKRLFKGKPWGANVKLIKSDKGVYSVECYGQVLPASLTYDEKTAFEYYNYVKDYLAGKIPKDKKTVIAE